MDQFYSHDMSNYFASAPPYPTSLHVADLDPRVDEALLSHHFTSLGHRVVSVKIVRDKLTHQSAGYGYVNFATEAEALDALDKVNYTKLLGKSIRISRARPTIPPPYPGAPSPVRRVRNPYANIYIKNLDPSVDAQVLYQHCKRFGQITSIRVMENPDGTSKGYGFVAFEHEQEAQRAVAELNNTEFRGQKIYVTFAYPHTSSVPQSYGVAYSGSTYPQPQPSSSSVASHPYYSTTSSFTSASSPTTSSGESGVTLPSTAPPTSTTNSSVRGHPPPSPPPPPPPLSWRTSTPPPSTYRPPAYSTYPPPPPPPPPPAPGSPSAYGTASSWEGYTDPYAAYAASYAAAYNHPGYAHYMYSSANYPYPYGYAYPGYETTHSSSSSVSSSSSTAPTTTTTTTTTTATSSASTSTEGTTDNLPATTTTTTTTTTGENQTNTTSEASTTTQTTAPISDSTSASTLTNTTAPIPTSISSSSDNQSTSATATSSSVSNNDSHITSTSTSTSITTDTTQQTTSLSSESALPSQEINNLLSSASVETSSEPSGSISQSSSTQ